MRKSRTRKRLCRASYAALAIGLFLPALPLLAQTEALSWPPLTREARPWTRWWWHGSAVDSANITRNLEQMAEAGLGGVEVTAIYGVRGQEHRHIPYLSPRWTGMLHHAAREAGRLGMGLDMPPGSGWRTGGPFVRLEHANASADFTVVEPPSGSTHRAEFGDRDVRAVMAFERGGEVLNLTDRVGAGGSFTWDVPEGTWTLVVVEQKWSGSRVKRPAPGGEGYDIDPYAREAVDAFFSAYAELIRDLPEGTIRAFFHDSFEYEGNWTGRLFETFEQRHGYDLRRQLPALLGRGSREAVARVKSDYREVLAEMLLENFIRPFVQWSHDRGSLMRNQAHGSTGNLLDLYAAPDIPETEFFGPLTGPDADPLIAKFASSAAHVTGQPLVAAESYTWLGEHFTVTLDEIKAATDLLLVGGVNHIFFHGTAYSPEDAAWPGWVFYASTQLNPRNPVWRDLPALNAYIARSQSVLQAGRPANDVLLYWPFYDVTHNPEGLNEKLAVHDPDWFYHEPVGPLARSLWDRGFTFDYVSDRMLADARVDEGRLRTPGGAYGAVLVPETRFMPPETLRHLTRLAEEGAVVIFQHRLPEDVPGWGRLDERRALLRDLKDGLRFTPRPEGLDEARLRSGGAIYRAGDPTSALERLGVRRERMADHAGLRFIRRVHDEGHHYFVANTGHMPLDGWIPLSVPAASAALMDPMHGATGLAQLREGRNGEPEIRLQLEPGASLIVRTFADRRVEGRAWAYRVTNGAPATLTGTWTVDFVTGGPVLPDSFTTDSLLSWTRLGGAEAERFAGTARYTLRFDDPGTGAGYLLHLGRVAESARVKLNGRTLGTLIGRPFEVTTGPLRAAGNVLEIEVTNVAANRIRDLDRREVPWRIFHDINFVNIDYRPFDASGWPVREAGLLGPVTLEPIE